MVDLFGLSECKIRLKTNDRYLKYSSVDILTWLFSMASSLAREAHKLGPHAPVIGS